MFGRHGHFDFNEHDQSLEMTQEQRIERLELENKELKAKLTSSKIFTNMVIHDMRNPVVSQLAISQIIKSKLMKIEKYKQLHCEVEEHSKLLEEHQSSEDDKQFGLLSKLRGRSFSPKLINDEFQFKK